ncbi:MAG: hypothetical protein GY708_20675 [Actinomycetia bacterium]|nr:hypothetical protein [Actinomycetes bacterium]
MPGFLTPVGAILRYGAAVVPSDPVDSGDVRVLLLATQTPANKHFGQAQGDGATYNQNPTSDTWTFPTAGLWESTSIAGGNAAGSADTLTTDGDHDPVTGSERRTEWSFRGSGGSYDYDLSLNQTYWVWLRYWMPDRTAYPAGDNIHISPWQLHSKVGGGNPPSGHYLDAKTAKASVTGLNDGGSAFTTITGIDQPMDQWVTDIIKVKMNPGTSDGLLQVWRDGVSIVDETGIDFGKAGNDGFVKLGIYVFPGGTGADIYTDLVAGTTYSSLQLHVAGAGLVDDGPYSFQDVEDHAANQLGVVL